MIKQTESNLKNIRKNYKKVRDHAMAKQLSKVKFQDLKVYHKEATDEIQRMKNIGDFEYLDEVDFYKDRFKEHITVIQQSYKNKKTWGEITPTVQQIYKHKEYVANISYLRKSPDDHLNQSPPKQSKVMDTFFQSKRSKIVPDVGFKSLLENPQVPNKSFKKKIGANMDEIRLLRQENEDLKRRLEAGGGNLSAAERLKYQNQRRNFQQRMNYLEDENSRLMRQNDTLRSEKSVSGTSSKLSLQQNLYAPYFIQTQENDLYKINVRNQSQSSYSNYDPNEDNQYGFNAMNRNDDRYSQPERNNHNETYSVFDMSRSYFSENGDQPQYGNRFGIEDSRTVNRNKIAFFKQAGILVKDDDVEIGYKKSRLDSSLSRQKIILYFNNKTRTSKRVDISYDYERDYYGLDVTQKIREIEGFRQGREVTEVQLNRNKNDLNSIIQIMVRFGDRNYKLWLPVMLIEFRSSNSINKINNESSKSIYASKPFLNPRDSQRIWPDIRVQGSQGLVWGVSRVYEGPLGIQWKSSNKIQVKTTDKWLDMLTFIMFEYQ